MNFYNVPRGTFLTKNGMKIKDWFLSKEDFEVKEVSEGILQTQNIPSNISKYYESDAYLSHTNAKKSIIGILYAVIQKMNLNYKYKMISNYSRNGKLLDYGCGNGVFLQYMNVKGFEVKGFEPNEVARNQAKEFGITLIDSLETDERFDVITLFHVLEHISNPKEILQKLKSLLNENGKLIIAVPNYKSFDAKYYKEFWAAYDVPRHIFHYSKNGAIQFFRKNNFYLDKIYPLPFDSFFIAMMSANYQQSILQKMLFPVIGSISNLKAMKTGNWSSLVYILKNNN